MHAVSGTQGATPVWRTLIAALHAAEPSRAPLPPAAVVAQRCEWFVAGTEPAADSAAASRAASGRFGIQSPRDGAVLVLDPDIPMAAQRIVFHGAAGQRFIGGRALGRGERISWLPPPGKHVLERRSDGGIVNRVVFEVRAAPPPLKRQPG